MYTQIKKISYNNKLLYWYKIRSLYTNICIVYYLIFVCAAPFNLNEQSRRSSLVLYAIFITKLTWKEYAREGSWHYVRTACYNLITAVLPLHENEALSLHMPPTYNLRVRKLQTPFDTYSHSFPFHCVNVSLSLNTPGFKFW